MLERSTDPVIEQVTDDLHRICLGQPAGLPEAVGQPINVYLLHGPAPALINAGHPAQFEPLCAALRDIGVEIGEIERVIYTSWDVGVLGASANMPNIDHFVFSPDMVEPSNYEAHVARRRDELRALANSVIEHDQGYEAGDLGEVDAFIAAYYPPMPSRLNFIPIRSGHTVCAGHFEFEVIAAPGPDAGHAVLYDASRRTLFGGSFTAMGLPQQIDEVQSYLISLERLQKLDVDMLLLNHGKPVSQRGDWSIRRALRFLNNFMSSAPAAMHGAPTVIEFIERDLGYHIDNLAELVLQLERYKAPMDELVRARMIDAEGTSLARRYGTDVDDDRAPLRK